MAYGFDTSKTAIIDEGYMKVLGAWTVAIGDFLLSVANGFDATKALRYAHVPATLLDIIMLLVTKDVDKNGTPKGPIYALLIFHAVVVATLAND
jgi:hypothetical protein